MKINKILYTGSLALALSFSLTSCDSYLDENPDNRANLDSEDKIVSLLTSAYGQSGYAVLNEVLSDNTDDMGARYIQNDDLFTNEAFYWKDITEGSNDGIINIWSSCYGAIAAANHALQAIEELGGPKTLKLKECKAEALMSRHLQSQLAGNLLYREVAQLFYFIFFHFSNIILPVSTLFSKILPVSRFRIHSPEEKHFSENPRRKKLLFLSHRYSLQVFLCLRVKSRLVREGDEFAEHPLSELSFRAVFRFT